MENMKEPVKRNLNNSIWNTITKTTRFVIIETKRKEKTKINKWIIYYILMASWVEMYAKRKKLLFFIFKHISKIYIIIYI